MERPRAAMAHGSVHMPGNGTGWVQLGPAAAGDPAPPITALVGPELQRTGIAPALGWSVRNQTRISSGHRCAAQRRVFSAVKTRPRNLSLWEPTLAWYPLGDLQRMGTRARLGSCSGAVVVVGLGSPVVSKESLGPKRLLSVLDKRLVTRSRANVR